MARKKAPTKACLEALVTIANATKETGGIYAPKEATERLLENDLVEINEELVNEAGHYMTRATEKGLAKMSDNVETAEAVEEATEETAVAEAPVEKVKETFEIEDNIPLPTVKRGGGKGVEKYPFDKLEIGQSFHVPATEDRPNPGKTLASTVSSAKNRYKVEGQLTRIFVLRTVGEDDPKGAGARVFRVDDFVAEAAEAAE